MNVEGVLLPAIDLHFSREFEHRLYLANRNKHGHIQNYNWMRLIIYLCHFSQTDGRLTRAQGGILWGPPYMEIDLLTLDDVSDFVIFLREISGGGNPTIMLSNGESVSSRTLIQQIGRVSITYKKILHHFDSGISETIVKISDFENLLSIMEAYARRVSINSGTTQLLIS